MDQAAVPYTQNWRWRQIQLYIASWITHTYGARTAAERQDWPDFDRHFNAAVVYLRMVLDLLAGWGNELDAAAGRMTDAEIFDACYRELVKRWT